MRIVASVGFEVGVEASLSVLHVGIFPRKFCAALPSCRIFPLGFGGQSVALHEACHRPEALKQVVGAPSTEGICLFPRHAHHGIIVVSRVAEVVTQVHFVVRVGEIVHPTGGVGIHVHDISVEEVPRSREFSVDGLAHDVSVVVHVSGVFGYHHRFVGVDSEVGIEVALLRQYAVFAQCGRGIVVNLVAIVQLPVVEKLLARHRIGDIQALDGTLLVFVWFSGQRFFPVHLWANGVPILVFCNHIRFVSAVSGVGQACPEYAVAHPIHELFVLRVGHFRFIHPEPVHRNILHGCVFPPEAVALLDAHLEISSPNACHSVGRWFGEALARAHANHLSATPGGRHSLAAEAS